MASGNLGDLQFGLSVNDKFSRQLNGLIDYLNKIDSSGRKAQEAVGTIATIVKGWDSHSVAEQGRAFEKLSNQISSLQKEYFKLSAEKEKIANQEELSMGDLQRVRQLNREMQEAVHQMKAYANMRELLVRAQPERKSRYQVPYSNANSVKDLQNVYGKAFDTLGERLDKVREKMDALTAKQKREVSELEAQIRKMSPNLDGKNWAGKDLSARDMAAYKNLQQQMVTLTEDHSLALNKVKIDYDDIARQMTNLVNRSVELQQSAERMASATYKPYVRNDAMETQQRIQQTSTLKHAILERMDAEKKAAKEAEQSLKENEAALKRQEVNLEAVRRRYQQLFDTLNNLRHQRSEANILGLDTAKIDAEISKVVESLHKLRTLQTSAVGALSAKNFKLNDVTGVMSERDITLANRLAQEQRQINAEKQRAIELEQKHQQEIAKTTAKVQRDLAMAFQNANRSAGQMNSTLQDLKGLFLQGGLVYGAQQFLTSIIQTGGEMERQHIALQSILGDVQNANTMYGQIQELALRSPFTFSELNKDVKQLAAYGVEYENLYDTTKRLADMSAGLGVSFERIALAFGQVQARGWLDGKELRQIAYAGIPLLAKLSELYSKREGKKVSTSDVKKRISNREVGFEDVKSIFWEMTDAGGQFYNMQDVLSQTLLGRWLKLKDAWEIMLSDFASGKSVVGGTLSFMIDRVTDLVQAMHTLAPVVAAAFSGFALSKIGGVLGGGVAAGFLANKGKMADVIQNKALGGETLLPIEQRLLATKKQITLEDIQQAATAKAITATELQRMYVEGKISTSIYQQGMAMLGLQTRTFDLKAAWAGFGAQMRSIPAKLRAAWAGFGASVKALPTTLSAGWAAFQLKGQAAFAIMRGAAVSFGTTLWTAIGGPIGLAITGISMLAAHIIGKNAEIDAAIEQTSEELADKYKNISTFRQEYDVQAIKKSGDDKEIENAIEAYEDKLKEIAPAQFELLLMSANERKDAKERLQYLDDTLVRMKAAISLLNTKIAQKDFDYEDTQGDFSDFKKYTSNMLSLRDKAFGYHADTEDGKEELRKDVDSYKSMLAHYKRDVQEMADEIKDIFPNIANDPVQQEAAGKLMDAFFSNLKYTDEEANMARYSIMDALGLADNWLNNEVASEMSKLVENSSSTIAAKIQNGAKLTDAEAQKVKELMQDARYNLEREYPTFAQKLTDLLAASNFEAVIKLVYDVQKAGENIVENDVKERLIGKKGTFNAVGHSIYGRIKNLIDKGGSWYETRNNAQKALDKAYNEWQGALKSNASNKGSLESDYNRLKQDVKDAFNYDYTPSDKKSNKPPKTSKGNKEDAELKMWRERLDAAKKFYSTYKKYKDVWGPDKALEQTRGLFPDVADMDVNDYEGSLQHIIDTLGEGWFAKSPERLKFLTSIKESILDYDLTEVGKRKAEELSAAFNEELERNLSRYDLYKTLFEKTGNADFASRAFADGQLWDDNTKSLAQELKSMTGEDFVYDMTDKQAEHHFENISGAYELWKKIKDLVGGEYTDYLKNAADIIAQTMSTAQKMDAVRAKYKPLIEKARANGDEKVSRSYEMEQGKEISSLELERIKSAFNWDAVFNNTDQYSRKELQSIRRDLGTIIKSSRQRGMQPKDLETLYEGYEKLGVAVNRNTFGGMDEINAELIEAMGEVAVAETGLAAAIKNFGKDSIEAERAQDRLNDAQNRRRSIQQDKQNKTDKRWSNAVQLGNMFTTLGNSNGHGDTFLDNAGSWTSSVMGMFGASDSTASKVGGIVGMAASMAKGLKEKGIAFIGDAVGDVLGGVNTVLDTVGLGIGPGNAATKRYEDAKKEYENLIDVWDKLIDRKTQYLSEHWGTEAANAASDAQSLIQSEIRETQELYKLRAGAGKSVGSHSYGYKSWKGHKTTDGQNWKSIAPEISSALGVEFTDIKDLADMSGDKLKWIMENYPEFWAILDSTMREYLENIIDMYDQIDDLTDTATEKLTGMNFSTMVDNWGSALATMSNGADNLMDSIEDGLKEAILKGMVEEVYGDRIKALIAKTKEYGENGDKVVDGNGKTISEYTAKEYASVKSDAEELTNEIKDTRDMLERMYGWSDSSSSSATNTVSGITEEEAGLGLSYLNAIRLDVSVNRENVKAIADAVVPLAGLNAIAEAQLVRMAELVDLATSRNELLSNLYDWAQSITTSGRKKVFIA